MMQVSARQGHDLWAAVYDDEANPLLSLERRTVAPWLPRLAGRTFADVACGTGRWSEIAAERGARVFGADLSGPMLARAVRRVPHSHGVFVQSDAIRLPWKDALADVTICALAAGYIEDVTALIAELSRITRPGGHILLTDLHPIALQAGWRRAFRLGQNTYQIATYVHPVVAYCEAAAGKKLVSQQIAEVPFGDAERGIFRAAGKGDSFAELCRFPAIFAAMWRRP